MTFQTAPVVVVGADNGAVSVYSLVDKDGEDAEDWARGRASEQEQRQRLETALLHHTAQAISD